MTAKKKFKEFSAIPVGRNFVLKDKDGIDTIFIVGHEGEVKGTFTHVSAVSLRGAEASGNFGLPYGQVVKALRIEDDKEFNIWWQNNVIAVIVDPKQSFTLTPLGNVVYHHVKGVYVEIGYLPVLTKMLSTQSNKDVITAELATKLEVSVDEAKNIVTDLVVFVLEHNVEHNNHDFSILQDKFTTGNSLKEAIAPMACPKREDEDTNIDDIAKVTTGTSTDGGCYLPSGTKINVEDLLQPGKIFEHNSTANHYVVEKLAKIRSSEDGEWCDAVIYHPVTKPKETFAQPIPLFIKKMTAVLQTYEIWLEGYRATGTDWKAEKMGEAQGYCFAEACHALFTRLGVQQNLNLSNPVRPYVVGRGDLYDNEAAARAFNG